MENIGGIMDTYKDISSRAMDILKFIEYKYVSILEEILAEESELESKQEKTIIDEIRLIGLRAMKKHIAEELGIPVEEEAPDLMELMKLASEEVEATA